MSQGESPSQARLVVEAALASLGWAEKASFEREDALTVSQAIGALALESLASSSDPADQQVAEGLRLILAAMPRGGQADARAARPLASP